MISKVKFKNMTALAEYRNYLRKNPRLTYLFFELTDKCNLACKHCGSSCSGKNSTFLDKKDIFKVIDGVYAEYGSNSIMICLTGGEPLLHPEFFEIVDYINKKGFVWGITSNATLIDDDFAKRLVENKMSSLAISLDGLKDTHDNLRNSVGSFENTINGINNLVNASKGKLNIMITSVIHKQNIHQLNDMMLLVESLNVNSWRVINLEPIGRANLHKELLLNKVDFKYLLDFIIEKRFDKNIKTEVTFGCSHYVTPFYEHEVRGYYFLCGSGITVASILCNGDIYSCLDIERIPELVQGNIKNDDFVEVWQNNFKEFRQDRSELCEICKNCTDRLYCAGDSTHTWNFHINEPQLCLKKLLCSEE